MARSQRRTVGTPAGTGGGFALRVLNALKERTATDHRLVEDVLDLLDPTLDATRLGDVLARLSAFWHATETALERWADGSPALAGELDWPRRCRSALYAEDCRTLGAAVPADRPALPFGQVSDAAVLGWLYVSEGSTLGGAVLARRLAPLGLRASSFTPYAEGPGPMWRSFGEVVQAWSEQAPGRAQDVVRAGELSFRALATWVAPLQRRTAA